MLRSQLSRYVQILYALLNGHDGERAATNAVLNFPPIKVKIKGKVIPLLK
jgi:hypothetical protein